MKPLIAALVLTAMQQSCIDKLAGPPEQIERETAAKFQTYFPNVKVHANRDKKQIEVMTCTTGLGEQFMQAIGPQIAQQLYQEPKLQQLRMFGQFVNVPYDYLAVEFEDRALLWSRVDGMVRMLRLGWEIRGPLKDEYEREYADDCGLNNSPNTAILTGAKEKLYQERIQELQRQAAEARRLEAWECDSLNEIRSLEGLDESKTWPLRAMLEHRGCRESSERSPH